MANLRDFLLNINKTLQNNEIEALAGASSVSGIEVTDDLLSDASTKLTSLMSAEAAQNNHDLETHFKKKLYPTIKGEILGNADTDIHTTAKELFGEEVIDKFKEKDFTGEKVKLLGNLMKEKIQSAGGDESLKKINEGLNAKVSELNNSIVKLTKDHDKKLKEKESGFENALIRKEYEATFNTYQIGDNYKDDFVRKALQNDIFEKASKVAKLKMIDGKVAPRDPNNDTLEYYRDNKKIEDIKGLIDPIIQPYLKATKTPDKQPGENPYKPAPDVKKSRLAEDIIGRKQQRMNMF
jgi:hypothetical protein